MQWKKCPVSRRSVRKSTPNCRWLILQLFVVQYQIGSLTRMDLSWRFWHLHLQAIQTEGPSGVTPPQPFCHTHPKTPHVHSHPPASLSLSLYWRNALCYPAPLLWAPAWGIHLPLILYRPSMAGGRFVLSSLMSTQMLSFSALHSQTVLPMPNDRICKLFNQSQDLEVRHLGRKRFPFSLFYISHPLLPHAVLHLPAKPAYIAGFPDHIPSFLTPAALRSCSK